MERVVRKIEAPDRLPRRRAVRKWLAAEVPGSLRGQIVVLSVHFLRSATDPVADEIVKQLLVERDADVLVVAGWPDRSGWEIVHAAYRRHLALRIEYATNASDMRLALRVWGVPEASYVNPLR